MRIFIGTILMTAALTVHTANAAATIPDYQPRPRTTAFSASTDLRDSNAAMPSAGGSSIPNRFYEIPARR
jgi:hypothetical protein